MDTVGAAEWWRGSTGSVYHLSEPLCLPHFKMGKQARREVEMCQISQKLEERERKAEEREQMVWRKGRWRQLGLGSGTRFPYLYDGRST